MPRLLELLVAILAFWTVACASNPTPRDPITESATVSGDGVSVRFRVAGADHGEPTIVLVHGFACDSTFWNAQLRHLAETHRVVAVDLPGHGRSGMDRVDWTMEAFGDDVRAVCDEIGAHRVVVVGHSMGGPVAVEAAKLMPDRVVAIVPVETFHDVERRLNEEQLIELLAAWGEDFAGSAERMVREFFFTKESDPDLVDRTVAKLRTMRPDIGLALLESMFRYDAAKSLESVSVPVRVINAADGQPTNVEAARRHARDCQVRRIERVGHFPMLEAPATVNRLLDEIVAEVAPPTKP